MSQPLQGRVAVVAGASSGIGLATAVALAEAGAEVHAMARRRESSSSPRRRVHAHRLDVGAAPRSGVVGAIDRIDVLVFAAGINIPDRRLEQDARELGFPPRHQPVRRLLRPALARALRATRGLAILIGSVSGSWPDVSGSTYQASKAGLLALARAAGFEEHERGCG